MMPLMVGAIYDSATNNKGYPKVNAAVSDLIEESVDALDGERGLFDRILIVEIKVKDSLISVGKFRQILLETLRARNMGPVLEQDDRADSMIVEEVKMRIKKKNLIILNLVSLSFLISSLLACAGSNPLSPGAWVAEENRISLLDGGQHNGSWQTRDLSIEYEVLPKEKSVQISGVVEFANYLTMGFNSLEYLTIYIHVLEADGFVEEIKAIKTFGYRRSFDLLGRLAFDSRMDLSDDAVAIAFSYSGSTIGRGGETRWDFWKIPRRTPLM